MSKSQELSKTFIGKTITVQIDRPLNSKHPKHDYLYPVNYGFIPGTLAPDGAELDAYVLGIDKPVDTFKGVCIAYIHREDDDDDKLIVIPEGIDLTDEEILKATHFQEQWFKSSVRRT